MRKAVTPVVAIILLIFMTVSASVAAFIWMTTTQAGFQETAGGRLEEAPGTDCSRLSLISVRSEGAVVQNTGCDDITKIRAIVDGVYTEYDLDIPLAPGEATTFYFNDKLDGDGCVRLDNGDVICSSFVPGCVEGKNPNNYPESCRNPNIIVFPAEGYLIFQIGFTELHYAYNTGGNTWSTPTYLEKIDWTHYEMSYDRHNNPVVGYVDQINNETGQITAQFWNNSWSSKKVLMEIPIFSKGIGTDMIFLYSSVPSMDSFPLETDNNILDVIFTWMNWTGSSYWENSIYYATGNATTTSPNKIAATGINLTYPTVSVDAYGNAHMIYCNLSDRYFDGTTSLYHSVYDREDDTWTSPVELVEDDAVLLVPKLIFNGYNEGLLVYLNYTKDSEDHLHYVGKYYDGSNWEPEFYIDSGKDAPESTGGGGRIGLAYDNIKWVLSYYGEEDISGNIPMYTRTYNHTFGLSDAIEDYNKSEFVDIVGIGWAPLLNNREGGIIRITIADSLTTSNPSVYAQKWNGTAFGPEYKLVNNLVSHPSCPFVYSYNGEEFIREHEAYGFAVFKGWEYESYAFLENLKPVSNELIIDLREELPEQSYTNKLSLKMVEHNPGVSVLPDINGIVHTVKEWVSPNWCSQDCISEVKEADDNGWTTDLSTKNLEYDNNLRDSLILTFDKPLGIVSPKLLMSFKETGIIRDSGLFLIKLLGSNNIRFFYDTVAGIPVLKDLFTDWRINVADLIVSVWNGSEWVEVTNLGVGGAMWNDVLIPLGNVDTGELIVKLDFSSHAYSFDEIKVDYSNDEEVSVKELVMLEGPSSAGVDDNNYLIMDEGDSAGFKFKNEDCSSGKECSYIVGVKGYYEIYTPEYDVALNTGIISKVLYLMSNPTESIRYCLKNYLGENVEVESVGLLETVSALIHYFT
ncbi:MAG: hypothetical protein JW791_01590 [Nanoarchaeota archaeon]|nr:hypothetical protein [Nanoarchaeota archaeon]